MNTAEPTASASVARTPAPVSKAERSAHALAEALRAVIRIAASHSGYDDLSERGRRDRDEIRAAEETLSAWDLLP